MTLVTEKMLDAAFREWLAALEPKVFDDRDAYRAWLRRIIDAALKAEELPQVPRPFPTPVHGRPVNIMLGYEAGAMQFTALSNSREQAVLSMYEPCGITLMHPPGDHVTIEFNGRSETLAKLKLPVQAWEHLKRVGRDQDAMMAIPEPDGPVRFQATMPGGAAQSLAIANPDEVLTRCPVQSNAVELVFKVKGAVAARLALSRTAYAMIQLDACRWLADDVRNACEGIMATIAHNAKTGEAVGAEAGIKPPPARDA